MKDDEPKKDVAIISIGGVEGGGLRFKDEDLQDIPIVGPAAQVPELPKLSEMEREVSERPFHELGKILRGTKHVHPLHQRTAVQLRTAERKKKKKRSKHCLHEAIIKPTSGHLSSRPNRHASKYKNLEGILMSKKILDFIVRIQAEGTSAEKHLEAEEIHKAAQSLAVKTPAPPHRQTYVKNLLTRALKGDLDVDVFKEFVKMTNTYLEVEQVAPRVKMLMRKGQ